jgi:hypothetical protein
MNHAILSFRTENRRGLSELNASIISSHRCKNKKRTIVVGSLNSMHHISSSHCIGNMRRLSELHALMVPPPLKGLGYCVTYRHENTQVARQVGMLGAVRRAPPLVRPSPALSSLLARIAQHTGLPDTKIERIWPSTSLKELGPPMQRLLLRPRQQSATPRFHAICGAFKQERLMEHLRE